MQVARGWRAIALAGGIIMTVGHVTLAQSGEGYAPSTSVRIHYRVFGSGRPLLVINGGPGWSSDHMISVAQRLADSFRVILFDQRGTGASVVPRLDSTTITLRAMIQDIEALRRHLDIDRWRVLGHSFGGMLAMAYAAAYPDRIEALALSAPGGATLDFLSYYPDSLNGRLTAEEREQVAFWSDSARQASEPREAAYHLMVASVAAFLYHRDRLNRMLAVLDRDTWSLQTAALVWADLARTGFDVRPAMRTFRRSVLVIQGRQDALGVAHAARIAHLFPDARLKILGESAHVMWIDQPAGYYRALFDFFRRGS